MNKINKSYKYCLKYFKIKKLFWIVIIFKNMNFYCISDQLNAAFVSKNIYKYYIYIYTF